MGYITSIEVLDDHKVLVHVESDGKKYGLVVSRQSMTGHSRIGERGDLIHRKAGFDSPVSD